MKTRYLIMIFSLTVLLNPVSGAGDIAEFGSDFPETVESGSEKEFDLRFDINSARNSGNAVGDNAVLQEIELETGSGSEVLISDSSGIEKDGEDGDYNIYVEKSDFSKLGTGTKDIQAKFTLDYRNFNNADTYLTETKQIDIEEKSQDNPVETYSLSLVTDGSGSIAGDSGGSYEDGTQINIEAVPDQGNVFKTFNGVNCNTKTCSFSIRNDMTVEAVFEQEETDDQNSNDSSGNQDSNNSSDEGQESDSEETETTTSTGLPYSADPSFGPSDGYLDSGGEEIRRIEWEGPSHQDTTLEIEVNGNGENVRLSCNHKWLGNLGNQTRTVDGETGFTCEIPSLFHREVETITVDLCNVGTNECREISKEIAFGPAEEDSDGLSIRSIDHPDSTTGDLPVEIHKNSVPVDKIIFEFEDEELEKDPAEQDYGKVKAKIPERHMSEGKNSFNVTVIGQNDDKDSYGESTFFLLENVTPDLEFSSPRIGRGFYGQDSLNGKIAVENPLESVYLDEISVNISYNGKSEKTELGELYPQGVRDFEFKTQIPLKESNSSIIKIYYKGEKVTEEEFSTEEIRDNLSIGSTKEEMNLQRRKKEIEEMINSLNSTKLGDETEENFSILKEEYETLKGLEVEDRKLADRYTEVYNEIEKINNSVNKGTDGKITGEVSSSPSGILSPVYVVPAVVLPTAILMGIIFGIRYRRSSYSIPLPEPVEKKKNYYIEKTTSIVNRYKEKTRAFLAAHIDSIPEKSSKKYDRKDDEEEGEMVWGLP